MSVEGLCATLGIAHRHDVKQFMGRTEMCALMI